MTHVHRGPLAYLHDELLKLEDAGIRRTIPDATPDDRVSFYSNDYLGFAGRFGSQALTGAGASRLLGGHRRAHVEVEHAFARWLNVEACLAFTSGYAANVGTLSALARPGDLIVSDALNHASLIDGARLSKARVAITPHNNRRAVENALQDRTEARAFVVVESYYSMDADGPDLRGLREIADHHNAILVVDEAHALGVLGPQGRGRCAEAGIRPDVLIGTFGKSFGSQGAFVAGEHVLREWLWNRARSFVFSTGLSPLAANAARLALEEAQRTPTLTLEVRARAEQLREGLTRLDLRVLGFGHVVPVLVGRTDEAVRLSAALAENGLVVPAIRPPTVAEGTARLRLAVSARHTSDDISWVIDTFRKTLRGLR